MMITPQAGEGGGMRKRKSDLQTLAYKTRQQSAQDEQGGCYEGRSALLSVSKCFCRNVSGQADKEKEKEGQ